MKQVELRPIGDAPVAWIEQPVQYWMHDEQADLNYRHHRPGRRQTPTPESTLGRPRGDGIPKQNPQRDRRNQVKSAGDPLGDEPLPEMTAQHLGARGDNERGVEREAPEPERDGGNVQEPPQGLAK